MCGCGCCCGWVRLCVGVFGWAWVCRGTADALGIHVQLACGFNSSFEALAGRLSSWFCAHLGGLAPGVLYIGRGESPSAERPEGVFGCRELRPRIRARLGPGSTPDRPRVDLVSIPDRPRIEFRSGGDRPRIDHNSAPDRPCRSQTDSISILGPPRIGRRAPQDRPRIGPRSGCGDPMGCGGGDLGKSQGV